VTRARGARIGRGLGWLRWSFMVIGAALLMALAPMLSGVAAAAPARSGLTRDSGSCGQAVGPFTVDGTRVLGAGGKVFVSYGTTVSGLQGPDWRASVGLDLDEIAATADDWCANTVRLQLSQDNLLGPNGNDYNRAYMNAIETEVSAAEGDHLVVVLNDDTELTAPAWNPEQAPTPETETFWKELVDIYGNEPQVIFDLFNEPRLYYSGMSQAQMWQLWLNGGLFEGVNYTIGMAQLAEYVRNTLDAQNLFWVEGPRYSVSFDGMMREGALLKVSGVVYAVHHPAAPHDSSAWYADFGYLVTGGIAPVVDGEWTNYEPVPTSRPAAVPTSCWPDAPTAVPAFLRYLGSLGIGLNVYTLQPGYMINSSGNMADPTTINAATWSCQSDQERQPGEGAGSLVMAWFRQNNG
jgi:Cellulase (glycosyl hydrolase family 5)